MPVRTKRIYDKWSEDDGFRILVDRLWPRGISSDKGKVDLWLKEIAPSDELRRWFAHTEEKWDEFKQKYCQELADKGALCDIIIERSKQANVTILYGARNRRLNNAVALRECADKRIKVTA
jgi:uncharacterized protein YeaO (DUF488 family)